MAGLGIVFRKEFVDSMRERRSVVSALVFGPLLGPVMFVVLTSYAVNLQIDESEQPIDVPVLGGEGAANLMTHLFRRQIDVDHKRFADLDALRQAVRTGDVDVGLVLDPDFGQALHTGDPARLWIVADLANNTARRSVARLRSALVEYGAGIGTHRLLLRGLCCSRRSSAAPRSPSTRRRASASGGRWSHCWRWPYRGPNWCGARSA